MTPAIRGRPPAGLPPAQPIRAARRGRARRPGTRPWRSRPRARRRAIRPPRCGWRASSAAASASQRGGRRAVEHRLGAAGGLVEAAIGIEQDLRHPAQPLAQRLGRRGVAHAQHQVGRRLGQAQPDVVVRHDVRAVVLAAAHARGGLGEDRPSPPAPPTARRARPHPRPPGRTRSRRAGSSAIALGERLDLGGVGGGGASRAPRPRAARRGGPPRPRRRSPPRPRARAARAGRSSGAPGRPRRRGPARQASAR